MTYRSVGIRIVRCKAVSNRASINNQECRRGKLREGWWAKGEERLRRTEISQRWNGRRKQMELVGR